MPKTNRKILPQTLKDYYIIIWEYDTEEGRLPRMVFKGKKNYEKILRWAKTSKKKYEGSNMLRYNISCQSWRTGGVLDQYRLYADSFLIRKDFNLYSPESVLRVMPLSEALKNPDLFIHGSYTGDNGLPYYQYPKRKLDAKD